MKREAAQKMAARKAKLLLDIASYRTGIVQSKAMVTEGLRAESLIQGAVDHIAAFAVARLGMSALPRSVRLQTFMPLAVTAVSFLMRRKLLKLTVGVSLVSAAAVAWNAWRNRPQQHKASQTDH